MSQQKIRCMGCMEEFSSKYEVCPHCGYIVGTSVENALHMNPGTILADKYMVGRVIGYGGFGITYIAWDEVLHQKVAIKEYLPSEFSTRAAGQTKVTIFTGDKTVQFWDGMSKFVDEAKRLAHFHSENGIVKIFDGFEENNTAYIVMEYLDGETLAEYLEREKSISPEQAIRMIEPVIHSLSVVHREGIIHRDIAPDNIFLTKDGKVKLIDFGAARYATTTKSRSLTVIIKPGYSPEEQYRSRSDQGAHTDVYSIGAVLYRMITGEVPPDALERRAYFERDHKDILKSIRKFTSELTANQENAIYNALNVRIEDRSPDTDTLLHELTTDEKVRRRGNKIKRIDPLTWPLWAKVGVPSLLSVMVVLILLLSFGVIGPRSGLSTRAVIPEGQTMIPDIIAKDEEDAKKKLSKKSLGYVVENKIESELIKKGCILYQAPDAGNIVDIGTIIGVTISAGRGEKIVPDVVRMSEEEATKSLEALGFVVKIKVKKSGDFPAGTVMQQSARADEPLEIGTEIVLTVNKDSEQKAGAAVKIPKLTGMALSDAIEVAAKSKLQVQSGGTEFSATVPKGEIISQRPAENSDGNENDIVTVIISKGVETAYVEDLYGRDEAAARRILENAGLKVIVVDGQSREVSEGVVYDQNIINKNVPLNTTVQIYINRGYKVTVPNVKGLSLSEAQSVLSQAGLASRVISRQTSVTVDEDRIISQNPSLNSEVEKGSLVELVVSDGAPLTTAPTTTTTTKSTTTITTTTITTTTTTKPITTTTTTQSYDGGGGGYIPITPTTQTTLPNVSTGPTQRLISAYEKLDGGNGDFTALEGADITAISIWLYDIRWDGKLVSSSGLIEEYDVNGNFYEVVFMSNGGIQSVQCGGTKKEVGIEF